MKAKNLNVFNVTKNFHMQVTLKGILNQFMKAKHFHALNANTKQHRKVVLTSI